MIIGRILGWAFLAGALFAIGFEISDSIQAGAYVPLALGELWHNVHPNSLLGAQALIQREEHLGLPWLWEPGVTTVLRWSGWVVLGAIATGLLILFRRRKRR